MTLFAGLVSLVLFFMSARGADHFCTKHQLRRPRLRPICGSYSLCAENLDLGADIWDIGNKLIDLHIVLLICVGARPS